MKKKHVISGLAVLGIGAAAAAAVVAAKQLKKDAAEPEDAILLDLDGDGVADVVLEDLDGDGKIDSVSTDVAAETETKTPAEAPVAEAPAADEAPAAAVTTENPDLITTIPVEETSTEEAPEAASEAPDENN